jgi:hypothetical protein
MKKGNLALITIIFLTISTQAQVLTWKKGTINNSFFEESNWKNGSKPVPSGTLDPSCLIGNDLLIENSKDLLELPGIRNNISLNSKFITLKNSEVLLEIPQGIGIDLGNGKLALEDSKLFTSYVNNGTITLSGKSSLFLYATNETLKNTSIDILSEDSWVYFVNADAGNFPITILNKIKRNGIQATTGGSANVRVFPFNQGVVVAPVVANALMVYDNSNLAGSALSINVKWTNATGLGSLNNAISSFKLKKGYMAVMMDTEDGSSISKTFIALDEDLTVNLEASVNNKFSIIRLVPWKYTSKKGACFVNNLELVRSLNATWFYEWEIKGWSQNDLEFVHLMRGNRPYEWNLSDPNWNDVKQQGNPHFLYLNEPESASQGNVDLDRALAGFGDYLGLGLRTGSPAYVDNAAGWAELDKFVTGVQAKNERLDFIAVHYYQRGNAQQLINRLQGIYDKYKLPIWITELNHGCTWTGTKTVDEGKKGIEAFVSALDKLDFVERYSVFSCGGDDNGNGYSLFKSFNPLTLNSAGEFYRDHIAPSTKGFTPPYFNVLKQATISNLITSCNVLSSNGDLIKEPVIRVLPNPFDNFIIIQTEGNVGYLLWNTLGLLVSKGSFENNMKLETSDLSQGTYILEVKDEYRTKKFKIVK